MAPAKPSAVSSVAKNIATSLSSPVSLLWAHQLRREHSALLGRVEGLANAIDVSSVQLNALAAQATTAERKLINIEPEQTKLREGLDRAEENEKRLSDELASVSGRIDVLEGSTGVLRKDFHIVEEQLRKDLMDRLTAVERKLQQNQEQQKRQVQELKFQYRDIQNRLLDIVKEGIVGVRDSMEEVRQQSSQVAEHELHRLTPLTGYEAVRASGIIQSYSEQTGDMLTFQPRLSMQADLCPSSDIDLDKNMLTPRSDVDEVGQMPPEEKMTMLPETPRTKSQQHRTTSLPKQEKSQSCYQYLTTSELLLVKLPKRQEGMFVEAFVDGIHDEKIRRKCEIMLDGVGWSWDNVTDFFMKFASPKVGLQTMKPTESLTHKHRKGEICPICSKQVNVSQSSNIAEGVANSPVQNVVQEFAQRDEDTGSRRRSQRIHQQSHASPARSENVIEPRASKGRTSKSADKSRIVIKGMSAQIPSPQDARAKIKPNREKLAVTESERILFTGNAETLTMPQGGLQQENVEVVEEDRRTRKGVRSTPDVPRDTERASMQKTGPAPLSKIQPSMPVNHTKHNNSSTLPIDEVNTTTDEREFPEKERSKKRKLVEQLEVPGPTKHDLVTPLDERIRQDAPNEPGRRKRRRRRAVAPIPMIPILPISDDE